MTVTILIGDVRERLRQLPADSFDCVVTSPPYWGLRDYGVAGQLGLEPTMTEHLAAMVDVFAEVHRVLKPTGTMWVNYGDCYATTPNGRSAAATKAAGNDDRTFRDKPFSTIGGALKAKDLCMVPNRLAIALQEWGWWVRSEIIWAKPNPMPESIKDRPATSHEKIFMLTKSARYFYAADAVAQPVTGNTHARLSQDVANQVGSERANGGAKTNGNMKAVGRKRMAEDPLVRGGKSYYQATALVVDNRNLRNYEPAPVATWLMGTAAFSEAHFATFPPELVERCLNAGCPVGVCPHCGGVLDLAVINYVRSRTNGQSELPVVRSGGPGRSQGSAEEVLQPGLFVSMDSETPVDNQGVHDHIEGVRGDTSAGSSERVEGGLRTRAPAGDGEEIGAPVAPDGGGSPQGWGEVTQLGGQSGSADEGSSRSIAEGKNRHDPVSALRNRDKDFPTCPHCGNSLSEIAPAKVLDPFGGAGTTALVADQMRRDCTIIELNPDYVHIAVRRIEADRGALENLADPLLFDLEPAQ